MSEMTHIFAVAGNPVLHSKSPQLFNRSFSAAKKKAVYTRIAAESASEAISLFKNIGLSGMNVTSPFKQDIMKELDELAPATQAIGAVNTVVKEEGLLKGYNTDHIGVTSSLKGRGLILKNQYCLVLGAGGAARAAAYGLVREGARVTLVNRTSEKAVRAANTLGCQAAPLDELGSLLNKTKIVVSALAPRINPIQKEWLSPSHVILDANYPHSPLIVLARTLGCRVIRGEDWLLNQAIPVYKLFTGKNINRKTMKHALSLGNTSETASSNIALIGFMGCGKTTIGQFLAKRLGYSFKDMDRLIEKRSGQAIPEIFRHRGEQDFRALENSVLSEIHRDKKTVYACGGGAVLDASNRDSLRQNSLVIWLHASLESCLRRIDPHSRPLLAKKEGRGDAQNLYKIRIPYYAQTADLVISSEKEPEKTAENIYEEIHHAFSD